MFCCNKGSVENNTNKSGVCHWLCQRAGAILILPLTWCFIYHLIQILRGCVAGDSQCVFNSNYVITDHMFFWIILSLYSLLGSYHAILGWQVILDDYVSCDYLRKIKMFFLISVTSLINISLIGAVIKNLIL